MIEKIVSYLSAHPKRVFAIDAAGAMVSAIFLGLIMPALQSIFGMPSGICLILAVFPLIFFVYDILVLLLVRQLWGSWLKIIATLNFAYTLLSLVIIYLHFNVLNSLGLAYFFGEMLDQSEKLGDILKEYNFGIKRFRGKIHFRIVFT